MSPVKPMKKNKLVTRRAAASKSPVVDESVVRAGSPDSPIDRPASEVVGPAYDSGKRHVLT